MTQIKYCTDGVLLREMMDDPLLSNYRCSVYLCCNCKPANKPAQAVCSLVLFLRRLTLCGIC